MNSGDSTSRSSFQLLTSPGPAAIAVVRLRGFSCRAFMDNHLRTLSRTGSIGDWSETGRIHRAELLDQQSRVIDDILVSVHAADPTWDLRLHLHGGRGVVGCCRELLEQSGFIEEDETVSTLWASDNAIEAEAHALTQKALTFRGVQWLTRQARTLAQELLLLQNMDDFENARLRCRMLLARRGVFKRFTDRLRIALVGPPNVGKSTLANALADREVSVVSPTPGTTRDWVEIPGQIDGFPVSWLDTAGLWRGGDDIDAEAMRRTRAVMATSDVIVLVVAPEGVGESRQSLDIDALVDNTASCAALNKIDLADSPDRQMLKWATLSGRRVMPVSALKRTGLAELEGLILVLAEYHDMSYAAAAPFSSRQLEWLDQAVRSGAAGFRAAISKCLEGDPIAPRN